MMIEPTLTSGITIDARFTANRRGVTIRIKDREYRIGAEALRTVIRRLLPCAR